MMSRISDWAPQDPVEHCEDSEGEYYAVYSDRDQAEYDRLLALDLEDAHRERMMGYSQQFNSAKEHLGGVLEAMRRTILTAQANSRWHYAAADNGKMMEADELLAHRVTLEAQQFYATTSMDRIEQMNLQRAQIQEMKSLFTDQLTLMMTGMVYGHPHKEISTSQSKEITWEVPASWWQMLKRDVLGRKGVRMVERSKTFSMSVSARPFSAFPELPYTAPREWGPRIDLMLQRTDPYIRGAYDLRDPGDGRVQGG